MVIPKYMHFRAFLDKFDDKFTSDWGSTQYVGRAEKFFNYKGFSREIGMGFKVYAQSRGELLKQYDKLNYLASSQAPTYSSAGFMQGNLAKITVGSYIVQSTWYYTRCFLYYTTRISLGDSYR